MNRKFIRRLFLLILMGVLIIGLSRKFKGRKTLETGDKGLAQDEEITEINNLEEISYLDQEGRRIVKNPQDTLVLVNKEISLPSDYIPEDLVVPKVKFSFEEDIEKRYLRKEAAEALEALFEDAKEDNIHLFGVSGYRSYKRQEAIFNNKVERTSLEEAKKLVALPGQSEHQTGLSIDVSSHSMGFLLEEEFENTEEGQWLKENCHRHGFIIRYPRDKTEITQYDYEPWHIRYVGNRAAEEIFEQKITLEEYLGLK